MSEKKSFVVRHENAEQFDMLTDEQLGQLFRAMYRFSKNKTEPDFEDPMLKMLFSIIRGQIERDAEKYEEACQKNAENGRKGGRPKKNRAVSKKTQKSERFFEKPKKADSDCDCDSECECDPEPDPECEPVCDRECDRDTVRTDAQNNTAHTAQPAVRSVEDVLTLAGQLGYSWSRHEAEDFLAYNLDKGRTSGWGYAAKRWEANRRERSKPVGTPAMSYREQEKMADYLSLVNNFDDGEVPV